jgi:DNA-directed RNA polymerase subunit omega
VKNKPQGLMINSQLKIANNEREGMRYPAIDELSSKADSKYKLVIGVSERAKEIKQTQETYLPNTRNYKEIGIALEEIVADKIKIC